MFKVGDQVICVNSKGTEILAHDTTYIVSDINFPSIMGITIIELEGVKTLQSATRFMAVSVYPTLKSGYFK